MDKCELKKVITNIILSTNRKIIFLSLIRRVEQKHPDVLLTEVYDAASSLLADDSITLVGNVLVMEQNK